MNREGDFNKVIENIHHETLPSHSRSLRAAAYYIQGLQRLFQSRYNEAKWVHFLKCEQIWLISISRRYLKETLKMANPEDRRTFCSLVLLGHIFLSRWVTVARPWTWSHQQCSLLPKFRMFTYNGGSQPSWKVNYFVTNCMKQIGDFIINVFFFGWIAEKPLRRSLPVKKFNRNTPTFLSYS